MWGSDIKIWYPDIDFFTDKIDRNQPFSVVKWNHGVWDVIFRCHREIPLPSVISDDYLSQISNGVLQDGPSLDWHLHPWLLFECLKIINHKKEKNFFFGIMSKSNRLYGGSPAQIDIIKTLLGRERQPFMSGDIWRRYLNDNKFDAFMRRYQDRIVYIGPWIIDFVQQIHIPLKDASRPENVKKIMNGIRQFHKPGNIYVLCAGLLSTHVASQLHNELKEAYIIDAGSVPRLYWSLTGMKPIPFIAGIAGKNAVHRPLSDKHKNDIDNAFFGNFERPMTDEEKLHIDDFPQTTDVVFYREKDSLISKTIY